MNIIHTADWHIGKQLYKHGLYEDIHLFFEELVQIIKQEKIDLVLISGDIFDLANPSNLDKEIYYTFLRSLIECKVVVIVTAGNHDSARMLDGPKDLLSSLNIHIVGETKDYENQLIPIKSNKNNTIELVVAAVPYLRDKDIRKVQAGESYAEKLDATRNAIIGHYISLYELSKQKYKGIPIIAMGHLFMQGSKISDSERDIQIGNEAGISVTSFDMGFQYFALGHIHRPQKLSATIRYSGSPIALSFSERKDEKQIIFVSINEKQIQEIRAIKLKKYRNLLRITGTMEEVKVALATFKNNAPLPALIEIQVEEENRDEEKILELMNLPGSNTEEYTIINTKISFKNQNDHHINVGSNKMIGQLKPIEVFRSRITNAIPDDESKEALETAFLELVERWNTEKN